MGAIEPMKRRADAAKTGAKRVSATSANHLLLSLLLSVLGGSGLAAAQQENSSARTAARAGQDASAPIEWRAQQAVHEACEDARAPGRPTLYVADIDDVRLRSYERTTATVAVDTRRNFRLFDGMVELFPAGL